MQEEIGAPTLGQQPLAVAKQQVEGPQAVRGGDGGVVAGAAAGLVTQEGVRPVHGLRGEQEADWPRGQGVEGGPGEGEGPAVAHLQFEPPGVTRG